MPKPLSSSLRAWPKRFLRVVYEATQRVIFHQKFVPGENSWGNVLKKTLQLFQKTTHLGLEMNLIRILSSTKDFFYNSTFSL